MIRIQIFKFFTVKLFTVGAVLTVLAGAGLAGCGDGDSFSTLDDTTWGGTATGSPSYYTLELKSEKILVLNIFAAEGDKQPQISDSNNTWSESNGNVSMSINNGRFHYSGTLSEADNTMTLEGTGNNGKPIKMELRMLSAKPFGFE